MILDLTPANFVVSHDGLSALNPLHITRLTVESDKMNRVGGGYLVRAYLTPASVSELKFVPHTLGVFDTEDKARDYLDELLGA
jgi:hypothetical protein